MTANDALRQQIRRRRRQIDPREREAAARGICAQLFSIPSLAHAKKIAVYLAQQGEADLTDFIHLAWKSKKRIFLPVLTPPALIRMRFAHYHPRSCLIPNRFHIPEPVAGASSILRAPQLDIVLMPLVGFDKKGHRLGMGGGYYDRTFSFRLHRQLWRKPLLVGIAYDFQEISELKSEPWDVPLDIVVTPTRVLYFTPAKNLTT